MNPVTMIAALDRALRMAGRSLILRRYRSGSDEKDDHTVLATVSGFRPEQLVGDIDPAGSAFVISPTSFPTGWAPGERWPVKGDFLVVDGRERKIEWIDPRVIGDTIVRFDGGLEG